MSGFRRTATGRIVYDRPENPFTPKDVQRIMFAITNDITKQAIYLKEYRQKYSLPFRNIFILAEQWYTFYLMEAWDTLSFKEQLIRSGLYEKFRKEWKSESVKMFKILVDAFFGEKPEVKKLKNFVIWCFENILSNWLFDLFVTWEG